MAPVPKPLAFEVVDEESLLLMKDVDPKYCIDAINQNMIKPGGSNDGEGDVDVDYDEMSTEVSSLGSEEADPYYYFYSAYMPPAVLAPIHIAWEAYFSVLQRRPLLIKSITAFVLMALSDALAQWVEHVRHLSTDPFNCYRMLRFAIFGLVGAPWTHYYYDWLDAVLPPTPEPWTWTTAVKVFIDQFIQAPALLALIIAGLGVMEGEGPHAIWSDLQRQYIPTLIANWKLWIPATIINIAFVKPILRVLYDNLVFFVWTIFLSIMLNTPAAM